MTRSGSSPTDETRVAPRALLGVDVGGTFTDAVVIAGGRAFTGKAASTPHDQSQGVIAAARGALAAAAIEPAAVTDFMHGMTVTTNALLEGHGARTALLATRGFTDLEELGRQARADLYRLCDSGPRPLVPPDLRFPVVERCGADGLVLPLDEDALRATIERIVSLVPAIESIAVCLLFSFRHPAHELRVRDLIAERLPDLHVSLSHEVVGTFREYERCATTIADAVLTPLVGRYLRRLGEHAGGEGLPRAEVMLSNGGTVALDQAARHGSWTVLSGPAGGAVGAARMADALGITHALCFDMGGTSTDVCVAIDGVVGTIGARSVGGRPLALPAVDIATVGAGGGSIAWRDGGGALRVGPRSAGADPGPACYGRGGELPTVTDANLLLGYLGDDTRLAGGLRLDRAAAERAIGGLAAGLGIEPMHAAAGIVEIANVEMLRALTAMTIARGIDPRDYALIAFGGAGPLHAAAIAEALEIDRIVCPYTSGVLSAVGLVAADRRRDLALSVLRNLSRGETSAAEIADAIRSLAARGSADLGHPPSSLAGAGAAALATYVSYDLRYRGQAFELSVAGPIEPDPGALVEAFTAAHRARYGYIDEGGEVELVTIRVAVVEPRLGVAHLFDPAKAPGPAGASARVASAEPEFSSRQIHHGGSVVDATVVRGAPPREGWTLPGPCVVELPEATLLTPPGWRVAADPVGALLLDRDPAVQSAGNR